MNTPGDEIAALLRLDRNEAAAQRAAELLISHPDDVVLLLNGAVASSRVGAWERATATLDRALALAPHDSETHRIASIVTRRFGDAERAFTHARRAVALEPDSAAAQRALATAADGSRVPGLLEVGEQAARTAVDLAPHDAESHYLLGRILLRRRRHPAAIAAFRTAVAIEPDCAAYHHDLAIGLHAVGDRRAASEHLVAAGRADPTSSAPIRALHDLNAASMPLLIAIAAAHAVRIVANATGDPETTTGGLSATVASGANVVLAVLVVVWLIGRWARRRKGLHPDAVAVLRADDELRGHRWFSHPPGRNAPS